MSLKIRLARGGAKKRPFYRIVVADARAPRDGSFLEKLGLYNPMLPTDHEQRLIIDGERIRYWLSVGAQPTNRVVRFLSLKGLAPARPIPAQTKKPLPGKKAQERERARAEKAASGALAAVGAES